MDIRTASVNENHNAIYYTFDGREVRPSKVLQVEQQGKRFFCCNIEVFTPEVYNIIKHYMSQKYFLHQSKNPSTLSDLQRLLVMNGLSLPQLLVDLLPPEATPQANKKSKTQTDSIEKFYFCDLSGFKHALSKGEFTERNGLYFYNEIEIIPLEKYEKLKARADKYNFNLRKFSSSVEFERQIQSLEQQINYQFFEAQKAVEFQRARAAQRNFAQQRSAYMEQEKQKAELNKRLQQLKSQQNSLGQMINGLTHEVEAKQSKVDEMKKQLLQLMSEIEFDNHSVEKAKREMLKVDKSIAQQEQMLANLNSYSRQQVPNTLQPAAPQMESPVPSAYQSGQLTGQSAPEIQTSNHSTGTIQKTTRKRAMDTGNPLFFAREIQAPERFNQNELSTHLTSTTSTTSTTAFQPTVDATRDGKTEVWTPDESEFNKTIAATTENENPEIKEGNPDNIAALDYDKIIAIFGPWHQAEAGIDNSSLEKNNDNDFNFGNGFNFG